MNKLMMMTCAAVSAFSVSAADWYVTSNGTGGGTSPSDRGDLMGVLYNGQIASGDTIHIASGTYNLDVGKIPAGKGAYLRVPDGISDLTLLGESSDPEEVRLVGNQSDGKSILYFPKGGNVLRNLLLSGGYTEYKGAGIAMDDAYVGNPESAFFASNCVVENCSARYMGANFGGLWRDCVIRNNEVRNKTPTPDPGENTNWYNLIEGSGGGVFHATLYDCVITNNYAGCCGGGIAGGRVNGLSYGAVCETRAYNCLIGWNRSTYGGGAGSSPPYCTRDLCKLFDCTLVGNAAAYDPYGDGGGLGGGAYQCVVSNCVVTGNSATRDNETQFGAYGHNYRKGKGGGVMDCEVVDSTLVENTCTGGGAGASNSDLTRCVLQDNSATGGSPYYANYGGGAYACSSLDCVFVGNTAGYGGGAYDGYLENCVISNNQSTVYDGGAAYNASTRNCVVTGNIATRYFALCKGTHYGTLVYGNANVELEPPSASGIGVNDGEELAVAVNCTVWNNDRSTAQISRTYMTNCIVGSVEYIPAAVNSFWRYGTVNNQTGCISGENKNPKFTGVTLADTYATVLGLAPAAFSIKGSSPCFDRGLLLEGQQADTDLLGNPRVRYDGVDMGAIECFYRPGFILSVY